MFHSVPWVDVAGSPAGAVQIAQGLAEHGRRWDRYAHALNAPGFPVPAVDRRGSEAIAQGPGNQLGSVTQAQFARDVFTVLAHRVL